MSKWPMVKLGELMRSPKSLDPKKFRDTQFSLLSIPAYDAGKAEDVLGINIGSSKKVLESGDVLLSRIVPHIRRAWVVPKLSNQMLGSSEWIIFNDARFHPGFLRHFLLGDGFHGAFMATVAGVGGSLNRARPTVVAEILIPLPPLEEQRRIAQILDSTQSLISKAQSESESFHVLIKAKFAEMFLDHKREWHSIGNLLESTQYGSSSKATAQGNTPMLRMGNISVAGFIDYSDLKYLELDEKDAKRYDLKDGDFLFNRTNSAELVGKSAIYRHQAAFNPTFAGYLIRGRTLETATPEYIVGYLNSDHGKATLRLRAKAIVGMANINATELKKIQIPEATTDEQQRFAIFYRQVEGLILNQTTKIKKLQALHHSLATRAFAGEL